MLNYCNIFNLLYWIFLPQNSTCQEKNKNIKKYIGCVYTLQIYENILGPALQ